MKYGTLGNGQHFDAEQELKEIKRFINIMTLTFKDMCTDGYSCCFDLFRNSEHDPCWCIYGTIHDEHGICDIGGKLEIATCINFNEALGVLADSKINILIHADYFDM